MVCKDGGDASGPIFLQAYELDVLQPDPVATDAPFLVSFFDGVTLVTLRAIGREYQTAVHYR